MALAAGLVIAVGLVVFFNRPPTPSGPTVKDGTTIDQNPTIALQFAVATGAKGPDGKPAVDRGVNHAAYPNSCWLLFRYTVDQPAWVYLVRVAPDKKTELIYPADKTDMTQKSPGVYDVNKGPDRLKYPLGGLGGRQNFCAVTVKEEAADLKPVLESATRAAEQPPPDSKRQENVDCIEIKVE